MKVHFIFSAESRIMQFFTIFLTSKVTLGVKKLGPGIYQASGTYTDKINFVPIITITYITKV